MFDTLHSACAKRAYTFGVATLIVLTTACSQPEAITAEPVQPTNAEIAGGFRKIGVPPSNEKDYVSVRVAYDVAKFSKFVGNDFYFVALVGPSGQGTARSSQIPRQHLADIPADLSDTAGLAVYTHKIVPEIAVLAKSVAKRSICVNGTVRTDDRNLRGSTPLTPEQQARVNAVTGGNPMVLLSMTKQDMQRAGLGDIFNSKGGVRLPKVGYTDSVLSAYAVVYLKCDR